MHVHVCDSDPTEKRSHAWAVGGCAHRHTRIHGGGKCLDCGGGGGGLQPWCFCPIIGVTG